MTASPAKPPVERELVFCLQAVQMGLCDARTLIEAGLAWSRGDAESLRAELLARSAGAAGNAALIDQTVELILAAHHGDVRASLESLGGRRELESLGAGGRVLESLGGALALEPQGPAAQANDAQAAADPGKGTEVTPEHPGRYELRGELGRGGIGKVLVAFDEHVGREVAIKELLIGEGSGSSTAGTGARSAVATGRFLREARLTAQLEHPSIVPVYEVGRRTDGTLYYAMRMVRGRTMADAIASAGGVDARLALLPHFGNLCAAIAYAHSRGVLHRDIKPHNVMIGEFGETVVLDWGLAKVKGDTEVEDRRFAKQMELLKQAAAGHTVAGEAMGTPEYMPPEQAWGELSQVDEHSDVYSLGAVLYELLTGRPPFVGDVAFEIVGKVQRYGEGKERLSPVVELEPAAPPELAAIAQKALAPAPADRYPSAKALLDDVSAFMAGRRVGAYEYSAWELIGRLVRKHKIAAALAAALLVLMVGGSAVLARAWQVAEAERGQAQAAERLAHRHLADGYQEKAAQLVEQRDLLGARIFAAAALRESPFNPVGPYYDAALAAERRTAGQAQLASLQSTLWATTQGIAHQVARLEQKRPVSSITFAPDGAWVATSGWDGEVALWRSADGAPIRKLSVGSAVWAIAVSGDGSLIAAAASDTTVRLWSTADGLERGSLPAGRSPARALAFSLDGKLLAAADQEGLVQLWSARSGERLHSFTVEVVGAGTTTPVELEFTADGKLLVVGGPGHNLTLWSVGEGRVLASLEAHPDGLRAMDLSPDSRFLVTAGGDRSMRLWSLPSGELLDIVTLGELQPRGLEVRFGPEGPIWAAVAREQGAAEIVDFTSGRRLALLRGHLGVVRALALSPDGTSLVTGGGDGGARLWRLANARETRLFSSRTAPRLLAQAAARPIVVVGTEDDALVLWNLETGTRLPLPEIEGTGALALSGDASRLAVAQKDAVRLFALPEGKELWSAEGSARRLVFSPDGSTLAAAERGAKLRLFDAADGKLRASLDGKLSAATAAAFSSDGKLLAVGGRGKQIEIWDPVGPALLRSVDAEEETISSLAFSPDGKVLAAGGGSWAIGLWDPRDGKRLGKLEGHSSSPRMIAFSPDGKLLVSTTQADGIARLWSAAEGRLLQTFAPGGGCRVATFAPDGRRLVLNDGLDVLAVPIDLELWREQPAKLLEGAQHDAGLRLEGFSLVPD